jgi:AraC-like DNA-binding protein
LPRGKRGGIGFRMATAGKERIEAAEDRAWSSDGLVRQQAIKEWHDHWSNRNPTPISITLRDPEGFAGRWVHYGLGQVRLLRLLAPAQRVVNLAGKGQPAGAPKQIHLIYSLSGTLRGELAGDVFTVRPGDFVMLDNSEPYVIETDTSHEVIDLIMPLPWLERQLADPQSLLCRPISMQSGWAPPLGMLLETLTLRMESCPLPRTMLAERIGAMLSLAAAEYEAPLGTQSGNLTRRIMQRIESDFADPNLSPDLVANELRISKRYLQTLLAKAGTSFIQELNTARLDRASEMLSDAQANATPIAEIAFRCGFLDPGYFTRLFRKRFAMTPRNWRGPR